MTAGDHVCHWQIAKARHWVIRIGTICALSAIWTSCATSGELLLVEERVRGLERERAQLDATIATDMKRLENLHEMLTQAELTLRQSGVNLGIRMERAEDSLKQLGGNHDAISFTLSRLTRLVEKIKAEMMDRVGATSVYVPDDLPTNADAQWDAAKMALASDKLREARAIFDLFEASHPSDKRADDALNELAMIQELQGDVMGAISTYRRLANGYPDGDRAAAATLRIADLFVTVGRCEQAGDVYQYVQQAYEGSAAAVSATERLETIDTACDTP